MAKLSYSIALNLLTGGVKKGIAEVNDGFSALQAKIVTFASALSLVKNAISAFSGEIISIVRSTNQAVTALQNVSGSLGEYARNQKFVNGLADKYGTNMNDLSTAYTKFTAAARLAGMPLKQQEALFTSVSRATAAFALNGEDTNSVFLALSQMMGKGKIQAQELRLQMGEKLPVAIQAMAKAAGVSVGQMDKLMQKGELLSAKVLPKFGQALDEMIPNVNTDHLETSIQRLDNAKIELMKSTPVSDIYKNFIDTLTQSLKGLTKLLESSSAQRFFDSLKTNVSSAISYIQKNFKDLVVDIVALVAGIKFTGWYTKIVSFVREASGAIVTNATLTHSKVRMLESQTARLKGQIAKEEVALEETSDDERLYAEVELNAKKQQLSEKELALSRAKNAEKVALERAAAVQSGNAWKAAGAKIMATMSGLGKGLKAIWSSVGPMILITFITEIIAKMGEMLSKEHELKHAQEEYNRGAREATHTTEIAQLQAMKDAYNSAAKGSKTRMELESKISSSLGQQLKGTKEINNALAKNISLLEKKALLDYYIGQETQAQGTIDSLQYKYGKYVNLQAIIKAGKNYTSSTAYQGGYRNWLQHLDLSGKLKETFIGSDFPNDMRAYVEAYRIKAESHSKAKNLYSQIPPDQDPVYPVPPMSSTAKKNKLTPPERELKTIRDNFYEQAGELNAKKKYMVTDTTGRKSPLLSKADYELQMNSLYAETDAKIKASKYDLVKKSSFAKSITYDIGNTLPTQQKANFDKTQEEYKTKLNTLNDSLANGALTQEEYTDALKTLLAETVKAVSSSGILTKEQKKYVANLKDQFVLENGASTYGYKNAWDSYRLSKTEKLQGQSDQAQNIYDTLKDEAQKYTPMLNEQLETAKKNATDLKNKLHLQQAQDDLKEFNKQVTDSTFDAIDGVESMYSTWEQFAQSMSETDVSPLKQMYNIFKAMESTVRGILSMMETFKKINEALTKAKGAEEVIGNLSKGEKGPISLEDATKNIKGKNNLDEGSGVTGIKDPTKDLKGLGDIDTSKKLKDSTDSLKDLDKQKEKSAAVTKQLTSQEIQSSKVAAAASTTESIANAATAKKDVAANTASAASDAGKKAGKSVPFPYNIIAIAGAIAAVMGLMASLGAFADGGVISSGTPSGDLGLARVNAGEMILNGTQQKSLFTAIQQGGFGGGGIVAVDGRVRGDSIYLSLHNYMKRTGKSL